MANDIKKLDIDSYYTFAIRGTKVEKIRIDEDKMTAAVVIELYDQAKTHYEGMMKETKQTKKKLEDARNNYFKEEKRKLAAAVAKEYVHLDGEVAVITEKARIQIDNKTRRIESKLKIIDDFRESEKEMLAIIDQSVIVEREKQALGESSWKNISAFIKDIKQKTLPSFQKRKIEEIDPLLVYVHEFKKEVKKIVADVLKATEEINVVYSKKILLINKNNKQEELRVLDLHRRTIVYLEAQLQTTRNNLKYLAAIKDELDFERQRQNENVKKKVMLDRKELMSEFSSNLDTEFNELESTLESFEKIGDVQKEMKNLSSYISDDMTTPTSKTGKKLIDSVVSSKEGK